MMWRWGYGNMMDWGPGFAWFSIIGSIFWLVLLIDAILLGIWLWQHIKRK